VGQALAAYELTAGMIRLATYNAHDCIGRDGVYNPVRIARLVAGIEADVVALQEITLDHAGDVLATLQGVCGMQAVDGTLFERGVGRYGNVLLTRHPVVAQALHDLSFIGREPRGLVDAAIDINGLNIRVAVTHLGLRSAERQQQVASIASLMADLSEPTALMGDFNVWFGSRALKPLLGIGFLQRPVRSFPTAWKPLLALDRVMLRGFDGPLRYWRYERSPVSQASDHYPVVVDVVCDGYRRPCSTFATRGR
jgi:endonuclease/exonuclease/phosphatase family metal-dependent hydrolase